LGSLFEKERKEGTESVFFSLSIESLLSLYLFLNEA